jgi:predicted negative regulator of RcsB-dependent stress response
MAIRPARSRAAPQAHDEEVAQSREQFDAMKKISKPEIWGAVLMVLAVFLTYLPALPGGFIWDDNDHLTENPCIVGPLGFKGIWTTSAAVYYPLVLTSFWVQHALWGFHPLLYHLVNVAVHAACVLLLWRLLQHLNVPGAWLGAALWGMHPVQVESVAWITELKNTQSCLFFLLSVYFFLKWRTAGTDQPSRPNERYYALSLLCAVLAILSKASTVMLPVVIGLCWWWVDKKWQWRNLPRLAPFFLISTAAGLWTIWEQKFHSGALGPEWTQSWPERLVVAGQVVWFYLGKLLWPHPLIFIYPRWDLNAQSVTAFLPFAAVGMVLFLLWCYRDGFAGAVFFAFAYFVIQLFPVMDFFNVYFFRYSFVGDHFQYLASMGPMALAGAFLWRVSESFTGIVGWAKNLCRAAPVMVLAALAGRHCHVFHDNETLWRDTLAKNPACGLAHTDLGWLLTAQGKALRLNPDNEDAHYDYGNMLVKAGRPAEAVAQYQQALQLKPADPEVWNNLGVVLYQEHRATEAIACFHQALRYRPDFSDAHFNLGNALFVEHKFAEAVAEYREALRLKPDSTVVKNRLHALGLPTN